MAGTAPTRYRYDVFLSHSSADKPVVRELAEGLRAGGLRVWFDEWIIKPGDSIPTAIEEGLEHSAVLLFCMSANAFGSDWVGLESHTALFRDPLTRDRRFVPLRLDDAPIKAMLRGYAYLDWRPGAIRGKEWGRLLEACGLDMEREQQGPEDRSNIANHERDRSQDRTDDGIKWLIRRVLHYEKLADSTAIPMALVTRSSAFGRRRQSHGHAGAITSSPQGFNIHEFLLSACPVSKIQWNVVSSWDPQMISLNAVSLKERIEHTPVTGVGFNEAVEFCRRVSAQTGRYHELPTSFQWNHAFRAPFSDPNFANTLGQSLLLTTCNPWGLQYLESDLWSWCKDGELALAKWDGPTVKTANDAFSSGADQLNLSNVGLRVCCLPFGTPFHQLEASKSQWRPHLTRTACEQVIGRPMTEKMFKDLLRGIKKFRIQTLTRVRFFLALVSKLQLSDLEQTNITTEIKAAGAMAESSLKQQDLDEPECSSDIENLFLVGRDVREDFAKAMEDERILSRSGKFIQREYPYSAAAYWWHRHDGNNQADYSTESEDFMNRMDLISQPRRTRFQIAYQVALRHFPTQQ